MASKFLQLHDLYKLSYPFQKLLCIYVKSKKITRNDEQKYFLQQRRHQDVWIFDVLA